MVNPVFDEIRQSAPGFLKRQAKTLRQTTHGWLHKRRVGFVFGCQRSGTKMLMRVLDEVPETRIFHENHAVAFQDFQLRSDRVIRSLVALNPAPVQVFKPICDSHRADAVLAAHDSSRAVWIYRHFDAVAASALKKWGDHQKILIEAILAGDTATWGWRTDGITTHLRQTLREVTGGQVSEAEGALLFWWLRNQFFFSRGLHEDPRVHLTRYSRMVREPATEARAVFDHLGAPYADRYMARVNADSIDRPPLTAADGVRREVRALCEDLLARLDAWQPPPRPAISPVMVLIDTINTGGAERYAITVANRLARQGAAVTLACSGGDQSDRVDPAVDLQIGPLDTVRTDLPRAALWLRRVLQEGGHQAVICNSLATTLIARTALPTRRIPIVNVAHGWPADRFWAVAPPMRTADRVVAVSPDLKKRLVEGGLDEGRCVVVHNGVNCAPLGRREGELRDTARREMGVRGPGDLVVVTVGRLEAQKAHHHIITVADRLRDSHPQLRFALVGGGAREDELRGLIAARDLGNRVLLLGQRRDVPDLLGSADLFLNCSDWEGMPLTTIEAMASGLPVVATHTEGAEQLLTEATGAVVPIADTDGMAEALARFADSPPLRQAAGQAARQRALEHFSHERMVDQLMDVVYSVARM